MSKRLTDLRSGALFVLLYHVTMIVCILLNTLLSPFSPSYAFVFSGFKLNLLPPTILLLVYTPGLYLLIRKFSRNAKRTLIGAHVLLATLTLFQYDFCMTIYTYYLPIGYLAIIPLYLICFVKRSAFVSWGALMAHMLLTVSYYLIAYIGAADGISELMRQLYGSNDVIAFLMLDYITRSILPLIPIIAHLIISLIQWGFSTPKPKQSIE